MTPHDLGLLVVLLLPGMLLSVLLLSTFAAEHLRRRWLTSRRLRVAAEIG